MSVESSKTLGGVGALLIAIGSFFPILSLVGIILVLIAMKGLAENYNTESLYTDALYGFIFGIIGIVAFVAVFVLFIFGGIAVSPLTFPPISAIGGIIAGLIAMFIFFLLQAIYYRKAFSTLAVKSGESMFETAGLLLLIGAILTIILVGLVLLFVAWILVTIGFFSIKTHEARPTVAQQPPPPAPVVSTEKKYCRFCGTENRLDAAFCEKCGKKIEGNT